MTVAGSSDWGKLMWVDQGLIRVYLSADVLCVTLGDDYPSLTKLRSSVQALPRIAEWIKNRPSLAVEITTAITNLALFI